MTTPYYATWAEPNPDMTPLQARLCDLVRAAGKEQVLLARDSGLSTKHVNQMILGRCEGSISAWQALLDAAGVTIDNLAQEVRENPIIRYADTPDGPEFDEFIAHNADIHIEAMGEAQWWTGIKIGDRMWHINIGAKSPRAKGYAICEEDECR